MDAVCDRVSILQRIDMFPSFDGDVTQRRPYRFRAGFGWLVVLLFLVPR